MKYLSHQHLKTRCVKNVKQYKHLLEISISQLDMHRWFIDIEKGKKYVKYCHDNGQSSVSLNKIPDWIHTDMGFRSLFIHNLLFPFYIYICIHVCIHTYMYMYVYKVTCESQLLFAPPKLCIRGTPKRLRAPLSSPPPSARRDERPRSVEVSVRWRMVGQWLVNGKWNLPLFTIHKPFTNYLS